MEAIKRHTLFNVLFGNNVMTYSEDTIELEDKVLIETLKNVDEEGKKTEEPCYTESTVSSSGGFSKKIKTATEKAMRRKHDEIVQRREEKTVEKEFGE